MISLRSRSDTRIRSSTSSQSSISIQNRSCDGEFKDDGALCSVSSIEEGYSDHRKVNSPFFIFHRTCVFHSMLTPTILGFLEN